VIDPSVEYDSKATHSPFEVTGSVICFVGTLDTLYGNKVNRELYIPLDVKGFILFSVGTSSIF
jgi:hypothetical protein